LEQAVQRTRKPASSPFDVPLSLPLVLVLAVLEVILNRGMGVMLTYASPRGPLAGLVSSLVFSGLLVNYMSTLMALVLLVHTIVVIVTRRDFLPWPRKITLSIMGVITTGAILLLMSAALLLEQGHPERVVSVIVTCQLSITVLALLFGFTVVLVKTGWEKRLLAVFPVLVLVMVLFPQFFHFYPLARPGWLGGAVTDVLLVGGHVMALVFPFPMAFYLAYQHMKHGLPVFIHVLVAISGFFPCLMLANMPSSVFRDLFAAMMGMPLLLPAPGVIYPLAILPLLFIFSTLVGTPVASTSFLISRRRAGIGLALVYLGTFTPLTAPQAGFLALGLLLWMKSIVLE
jgi:hypothetical protein